ncbi:hypothetical protein [Aliikangiella sp. IMCC44632]
MSLYDESSKKIKELDEYISTIKDTKVKLTESADRMSEALERFSDLNKPLQKVIEKDLQLDRVVSHSTSELKSEMASLKEKLGRDNEKAIEEFTGTSNAIMKYLSEGFEDLDKNIESLTSDLRKVENKTSQSFVMMISLVVLNLITISLVFIR